MATGGANTNGVSPDRMEKLQNFLKAEIAQMDGQSTISSRTSFYSANSDIDSSGSNDNDDMFLGQVESFANMMKDFKEMTLPMHKAEDFSEFKFQDFAHKHFNEDQDNKHTSDILTKPLLLLKSESDELAALAVWVMILRYMGDLPEPEEKPKLERKLSSKSRDHNDPNKQQKKEHVSVMKRLYSTLDVKRSLGKEEIEPKNKGNIDVKDGKRTLWKRLVCMTQSTEKYEVGEEIEPRENLDLLATNPLLEDELKTDLEKIHFIVGNGILRQGLRDEIYCQICKQLTDNPSDRSYAHGWILMALCAGCFSPSETLTKYLINFIKLGPPRYAPFIEDHLRRTMANGIRCQPPTWLEYQAAKLKKSIMVPVTFMDGSTHSVFVDPATTATELKKELVDMTGLTDHYGFSVYIAIFDKISSMGNTTDHLLDAVAECEEFAKKRGMTEQEAPWRLFFRKEIFLPWHDPKNDSVSTDFIYHQVVRGVKHEEYICKKDDDLILMAAQRYYIDNGPNMNLENLQQSLRKYIPRRRLQTAKSRDRWMTEICNAFKWGSFTREKLPSINVKEEVVAYAKRTWHFQFSCMFEVFKIGGTKLPRKDVVMAVNAAGVCILADHGQLLVELPYAELIAVFRSRTGKTHGQSFTLVTIKGFEYTFISPNTETIYEVLTTFIEGMKTRSRYALALEDYDSPGKGTPFLRFKKGDLVILEKELGKCNLSKGVVFGECKRTGQRGEFPIKYVYVMSTLKEPSQQIMALYSSAKPDEQDTTINIITTTLSRSEKAHAYRESAA